MKITLAEIIKLAMASETTPPRVVETEDEAQALTAADTGRVWSVGDEYYEWEYQAGSMILVQDPVVGGGDRV